MVMVTVITIIIIGHAVIMVIGFIIIIIKGHYHECNLITAIPA